ncbi:MAG: helix-turn-helix domain-containing protein [Flavobacteriales bacterium]|nr:helix-turn-helix domain-containing protein [Flavobacteriales bacterium]
MIASKETIRLIFGLKLRQIRQDKKLSLAQLSKQTGISQSYLNEIEKGKKYPKTEKIVILASALNIPYDKMVSLKLSKSLSPIAELLNSNILNELPLDLFGFEMSKVVELISNAPSKVNAFIMTLLEISRNYDMTQEGFYLATLRSYQELHENYFQEIEDEADKFIEKNGLKKKNNSFEEMSASLTKQFNYNIDLEEITEYPELKNFRSIFMPNKKNKLLINPNLSARQQTYVLGRELGFQTMKLKERSYTSSWFKADSFDMVLNNFKASYFSSALLLNRDLMVDDLGDFFSSPKWNSDKFLSMMDSYSASPGTFMHRLTTLIPKFFGLKSYFYLRIDNEVGSKFYKMDKELHLNKLHSPYASEKEEKYCRRWIAVTLLEDLQKLQEKDPNVRTVVGAQRSIYIGTANEYFCISIATTSPRKNFNMSITVGFPMDKALEENVAFCNDKDVPIREVNQTCQRCGVLDCNERVIEPSVYLEAKRLRKVEKRLDDIMN